MNQVSMLMGCKVVVRDGVKQTCDAVCLECGSRFDAGNYDIDRQAGIVRFIQTLETDKVLATHSLDCSVGKRLSKLVHDGEQG